MGQRSDFSKPCQGAAEKSANATRCCCLARGSQRLGMSTVEAVKSKDFMAFLFCKPWLHGFCTAFARSVLSMSDYVGRCIALQSVPFFAAAPVWLRQRTAAMSRWALFCPAAHLCTHVESSPLSNCPKYALKSLLDAIFKPIYNWVRNQL